MTHIELSEFRRRYFSPIGYSLWIFLNECSDLRLTESIRTDSPKYTIADIRSTRDVLYRIDEDIDSLLLDESRSREDMYLIRSMLHVSEKYEERGGVL